jgi:hypothetical protein
MALSWRSRDGSTAVVRCFCGNAQEHTHNLQVKQPPRLALDGLAPCVQWGTTTIGPVRGDSIETVSHGEDPRPQQNLLGLEAARIATAIVPLVMRKSEMTASNRSRCKARRASSPLLAIAQ